MKRLLLIAGLLSAANSWSQYEWVNVTAPNYSATSTTDAEMMNGKLYQIYDSIGYLKVAVYTPEISEWSVLGQQYLGSINKLQVEAADGFLYAVTDQYYSFQGIKIDPSTGSFTALTMPSTGYIPGNWELRSGGSGNKLFLLWVNNSASINLAAYDSGSLSFLNYDVSAVLNPLSASLSSNKLELYTSSNDVYAGVSGSTNNRLGRTTLANPSTLQPYNSAGANNGFIFVNSNQLNGSFYLSGDGNNAPHITVNVPGASYQTAITMSDVNINTATETPLTFVPSTEDWFIINHPAYAFIVSNFGVTTPNANRFQVYRQEMATMLYDSVGPRLETNNPTLNMNQLTADISDDGKKLAVSYKYSGASGWATKVLNQTPYVSNQSLSTGLCPDNKNLIHPLVEIADADGEEIRILSVSSINGTVTDFFVQKGYFNSGSVATTGFMIYGTIGSPNPEALVITYTDGWDVYQTTLDQFSANNPVPTLSFLDNPSKICRNEMMVNLDDLMIYTLDGTFSFNGEDLPTATLDATKFSGVSSGILAHEININGCYVRAETTLQFVNPGSAVVTTTPATCGLNDGTATVAFTPGSSSAYDFAWSTGEQTQTISNLSPGVYTAAFTDGNGCHTTAMAMVEANGITITPNVTPVSCYGEADGAVSLSISGMSTYTVLWSNGMSQTSLTGLTSGDYEVTVSDGQCTVLTSVQIPQPAEIRATFVQSAPSCGNADGSITASATGDGPFSYQWVFGPSAATISNIAHGIYQCAITDIHGCQTTVASILNDQQSPALSDSLMLPDCNAFNGAIDITAIPDISNITPVTYNWLSGETTEDLTGITSGDYYVTAGAGPNANGDMCYAALEVHVPVKAPLRQDICMVTVDLATTTNLVVWEKIQDATQVEYYNIYRENGSAGVYMLIDTVHYGSESVFNDVVINPMYRSWRYKISAVNSCGVESTISSGHKTLHLNAILEQANGTFDIFWDAYEGALGMNYVINRYSNENGWEALSTTYPMGTSYANDFPSGLTGVDYYVEMIPTSICSATKAQDFNSSRSNKDKGNFVAGNGTGASHNSLDENGNLNISVHPNPTTALVTIEQESAKNLSITVLDIHGNHILKTDISGLATHLNLGSLSNGIYFLHIESTSGSAIHRIVKI